MDMFIAAAVQAKVAKNRIKNKLSRDWSAFKAGELSGQGLIEYVLIIAVISLVVIFAGPAVTSAIREQFATIAEWVAKGTADGVGK